MTTVPTISAARSRSLLAVNLPHARLILPLLVLLALTLLLRLAPETDPFLVALKVFFATLAVGVLPGTVLVMLCKPLSKLSLLELIGMSIAVSIALVQILTFLSLALHLSAFALSVVTLALSAAGLVGVARWADSDAGLSVDREEVWIIGLTLVIATFLYLKGSLVTTGEDLIHLSVIRRLASLDRPALDNIYYAPNVVYTYPFPGIHFFIALVSRVGDVEPLFVYHKIRFFWGIAAIVFVYAAARLIFGLRSVAHAAALAGLLFVASGTYADVPGFSWAQLAPFSHASDVAMGVLLPALLVVTFYFLEAEGVRDHALFLGASLGLILMLTIVHIREVVQYVVYMGSFFGALLILACNRTYLSRTLVLLVSTLAMVVTYTAWHKYAVGHIDAVVEERRARLVALVGQLSPAEYVVGPFLDQYFSIAFSAFFYGWIPVVLFVSPFVLLAFGRRRLALFVAASMLAYLLIIRLPLFAIPYVYFTYFEILFTPVRNVIFFVHVLTGVFLYVLAVHVARIEQRGVAAALALAVSVMLAGIWELGRVLYATIGTWGDGPNVWRAGLDMYFLPLIAMFTLYLLSWTPAGAARLGRWLNRLRPPPTRSWLVPFALIAAPAAAWTAVPTSSPVLTVLGLGVPSSAMAVVARVPEAVMVAFPCSTVEKITLPFQVGAGRGYEMLEIVAPADKRSCPPSYGLVAWARQSLPTDAVMLTNTFNRYSPTPFMPQRIVSWPVADPSGLYWEQIFPEYFRYFHRAMDRYRTQPFFNAIESLEERLEFARALGVTHVLVDPMYHGELTAVLAQWPDRFVAEYDDGEWAVYGVRSGDEQEPGATRAG